MKKKIYVVIFLVLSIPAFSQTEKLADHKIANIIKLKAVFKSQNIDQIAQLFQFPLRRSYPISEIKNAEEFKKRYAEIFDGAIVHQIVCSSTDQWSDGGWRGVMLDRGTIWINSDDGKIIAVNCQSGFEKKLQANLIQTQRDQLHSSLKTFLRPDYRIDTKTYHLRIDELTNNNYRFASWKKGKKESGKPDLILNNGLLEMQGSGGNHTITFKNGIYTYEIYRSIIGEKGHTSVYLDVKKSGVLILREAGVLLD